MKLHKHHDESLMINDILKCVSSNENLPREKSIRSSKHLHRNHHACTICIVSSATALQVGERHEYHSLLSS